MIAHDKEEPKTIQEVCSVLFIYIKVWLKQPNPQVHKSQVI